MLPAQKHVLVVDGRAVLRIEAHPVNIRLGVWCWTCSKPSALSMRVAIVCACCLTVDGYQFAEHCPDCRTTITTNEARHEGHTNV